MLGVSTPSPGSNLIYFFPLNEKEKPRNRDWGGASKGTHGGGGAGTGPGSISGTQTRGTRRCLGCFPVPENGKIPYPRASDVLYPSAPEDNLVVSGSHQHQGAGMQLFVRSCLGEGPSASPAPARVSLETSPKLWERAMFNSNWGMRSDRAGGSLAGSDRAVPAPCSPPL